MLKPAQLYREQLREKELENMYNLRDMYWHASCGIEVNEMEDHNWNVHRFVSVDNNDNIIGYIIYEVNHISLSVNGFGIVSFDKGNITFIKDIYQVVYDIFYKYNFNRLEWCCYADNPAIRGYRKFIKRVGGVECGYKRQNKMLLDHTLHDTVEFEILKNEFKPIKRGVISEIVES